MSKIEQTESQKVFAGLSTTSLKIPNYLMLYKSLGGPKF